MKRILFVITLVLPFLWSCGETLKEQDDQDGFVVLPITVKGEVLSVSDIPLTKAGDSKDIYIIEVYASNDEHGTYNPYARGVFTDLSKVSIKLSKNFFYSFRVRCYKKSLGDVKVMFNEKLVYSIDYNSLYDELFSNSWGENYKNNDFVYSSDSYTFTSGIGVLIYPYEKRVDTSYGVGTLQLSNLDYYCSGIIGFNPIQNESLIFDMIRCVYGYRFQVDNLIRGNVEVSLSGRWDYAANFSLTVDKPMYESFAYFTKFDYLESLTFLGYEDYSFSAIDLIKGGNNVVATPSINISYIDEKGDRTLIYSDVMDFLRNRMKVINIHLDIESDNETATKAMSVKFEETPMVEETPITISQ